MTPYYKTQLERGLEFQDFVYEILNRYGISTVSYSSRLFQRHFGENKGGLEIKFDGKLVETGNLYIEVAEKSSPHLLTYVQSGIYRECNEYVIGNYDILYRLPIRILRALRSSKEYREIEINLRTSRGFLLPAHRAEQFAIQIIHPQCGKEVSTALRADRENSSLAKRQMDQLLRVMQCDPNQLQLFAARGDPTKL